jgi:hypothetical protein
VNHPNSKAVVRVDQATGERTRYKSRKEAAKAAPCSYLTVGTWLKDGREHYGYVWTYATRKYGERGRRGLSEAEKAQRAADLREQHRMACKRWRAKNKKSRGR